MKVTMPGNLSTSFPSAVKNTFSNSSASNPLMGMPHGRGLPKGRGGVKLGMKNPFQGAINKESLTTRKY